MNKLNRITLAIFSIVIFAGLAAQAQTTAFTFQGRLSDNNLSANGSYQMQFALYDAVSGGNQIGSTFTNANVQVTNGIFTVQLDFGANSFDGSPRFLEISVSNVVLSPRQAVTPAPYSIKSLNSSNADNSNKLGGINANQYVTGQVVRGLNNLTDNVTLAAGSNITITPNGNTLTIASTGGGSGGILNQTNIQSSANFNIDGMGSADIFNAATQYNIGGNRVLSIAGAQNLYVGRGAGASDFGGFGNSFLGFAAGGLNTNGQSNTFVGDSAGKANTLGSQNSFFGRNAGFGNTNGGGNSFFGGQAGNSNISGSDNSFFGYRAGQNTTASNNSFLGADAGTTNTTGTSNTALGAGANVSTGNLSFATAIGAGAVVGSSNTISLGRTNGSDIVRVPGRIALVTLGSAGSTALCRNSFNEISGCSSSLRYKTNIALFGSGLNLVKQLRPITFNWKAGGMADLGLGAEDVAAIEPLLVTYNEKGEVEGVKYDRIGVVLLNAVKEQQIQIEMQQKQIQQQQFVIDGLKKFICQTNAQAEICK